MNLRWLIPLLCGAVIGCGGGGLGSTNAPVTMQPAQWEFVATPVSGGNPFYLETNLTVSGPSVSSTVFNTLLFEYGGTPSGVFASCGHYDFMASISNGVLAGSLNSPGSVSDANLTTFSGASISTDGKSVSRGLYSAGLLCNGLFLSSNSSGTFSGYAVSPLNGTFVGTLNGSCEEQLTIQLSQDSNFGLTLTGTSTDTGSGLINNLYIPPQGSVPDTTGGFSNIIGATVEGFGTQTNVNGTFVFGIFGHFDRSASSLAITNNDRCGTESGTLIKGMS